MRSMKVAGLTIMAVLLLSAPVSAHEFTISKSGGSLLLTSNKNQVFRTGNGEMVCETMTVEGAPTAESFENLHATVQYSKCVVSGFIEPQFSAFYYDFNANGSVTIEREPATLKFSTCTITFPTQTDEKVKYVTKAGGGLEIVPEVTDLESSGKGFACEYDELAPYNKGAYSGTWIVMIPETTLSWK